MCRQQSWVIVHPPDDSRTAVFAEWPESKYWHWVCDGLLTINALGCEHSEELADEQRTTYNEFRQAAEQRKICFVGAAGIRCVGLGWGFDVTVRTAPARTG